MSAAALELARLLGPGLVDGEAPALEARARDCWPQALWWDAPELSQSLPGAVVFPERAEEVSKVLRWAGERGVPVTARGGGSGVLGAAVPRKGAIVVDFSRMTSVLEVEDGPRPRARVSAGWLGGALERALNARGLALCHVPASLEISTVGGWLAGRGSGQLSSLYGGIEAQTLGAVALDARGERLRTSAQELIGSEGTGGLIVEATLRVRRRPSRTLGWGASCGSLEEALELGRRCRAQGACVVRAYGPLDALASGLRSRGPASPAAGDARRALERAALRAYRLVGFLAPLAGRGWLVIAVWEDAAPAAAPAGASPEPARRWLERRFQYDAARLRAVFASGAFADTLDVWAPYGRLAQVEKAVRRACAPWALALSHVSHFDDAGACLYVTLAAGAGSRAAGRARHLRAWEAALEAAVGAGARATHHHGVGLGKLRWLSAAADPGWLSRLAALRREADPGGILNPGKLAA